ncbi:inactive peptidyl-prolyl cis-trans isomerase FKBP6-like [Leptopilina boulardi]|uniref:inactive peptidyl-prolyl cis-trans isomerase FKBP6-like n=1 Tax=Leptopilina boulardi TaxID=63433 RepID=UPI0021F626C1|nr:inactive peptidyl-prolyl cis-trans isomerase FKBP6-like [Leptopilina boulardi]
MARAIFQDGFTIQDLLSEEGVMHEITNECNINEEEYEYSKNIFMSNDDILKHLNLDDEKDGETNTAEQLMFNLNLRFDKLRENMTDVLGNGKIMKMIKKQGTGEIVTENAQVFVTYIGHFEYNDEPFDSSYAHGSGPESFILGNGGILPGLEISISTMKKHEVAAFLISPEYAYGKLGCPPRIPGDQEVLFVINLVNFIDQSDIKDFEKLSIEEQKEFRVAAGKIRSLMESGTENFRREKTKQAIRDYSKAVKMLEGSRLNNDTEEEEQKKLLSRTYTNLAICFNKENRPRNACVACQNVAYPNAKSYFNFGRALIKLGEYELAKEKLWKARELEPSNKLTLQEIKLADDLHTKYKDDEKHLWANCLKVTKEDAARTEFEKITENICKNFKNDTNAVRYPLPDGLTPKEDQIIRNIAISHGLSITNHKRYGKEIVFLSKTNY